MGGRVSEIADVIDRLRLGVMTGCHVDLADVDALLDEVTLLREGLRLASRAFHRPPSDEVASLRAALADANEALQVMGVLLQEAEKRARVAEAERETLTP